jgi:hypothetical protein
MHNIIQRMKVRQLRCNMTKEYKIDIAKTKTNEGVGLPYSIVAQIVPLEGQVAIENDVVSTFRKDLVKRYDQKDLSCHIDRYTRIATINFRKSEDAADFLMRS